MSGGFPCLVCGELHDEPACEPAHDASELAERIGSQMFRGALEELVLAWDSGDAARFTSALNVARKTLGRA